MKNGIEIDSKGNETHWKNGDIIMAKYYDGFQSWWLNNERHREDGPALIYSDGTKFWFYHGKEIKVSSQVEFERYLRLKAFW